MILHRSCSAHDPETVANASAEIIGGEVVEPPSQPYRPGAKWVRTFDGMGSMIEIGPYNAVWKPDEAATAMETGRRRGAARVHLPAPAVGEHTQEILSGELGLSAGTLADLKANGII